MLTIEEGDVVLPDVLTDLQNRTQLTRKSLVRILTDCGRLGAHVLLYGPPGTGKSELARALAARAGLRLFAVGEASEDGEEPSRAERSGALRLALSLTRHRRDAALLFDEAEDALEAAPRQSAARDDHSKAWLNRLLEANPTPVLWTCNGIAPKTATYWHVLRQRGIDAKERGLDRPPAEF